MPDRGTQAAVADESGPWLPFVQAFVQAYRQGERLTAGLAAPQQVAEAVAVSPAPPHLVILCSPHPDDECLTGALPLRLRRAGGARVLNLAMSLGSLEGRRAERWSELLAACARLGFDCLALPQPPGFALKAGEGGAGWQTVVGWLADFFGQQRPEVVLFPHAGDAHPAHSATHWLVTAALARCTAICPRPVKAVESGYWSAVPEPNLLVGLSPDDVARLLAALTCHRGEIARNPYHLTLPARLMDAVRLGSELVVATGQAQALFAELYRVTVWSHGQPQPALFHQHTLAPDQGLAEFMAGPQPPTL